LDEERAVCEIGFAFVYESNITSIVLNHVYWPLHFIPAFLTFWQNFVTSLTLRILYRLWTLNGNENKWVQYGFDMNLLESGNKNELDGVWYGFDMNLLDSWNEKGAIKGFDMDLIWTFLLWKWRRGWIDNNESNNNFCWHITWWKRWKYIGWFFQVWNE
jgi:hypothetical protein